ncbi:MAG TPA: hypothetical protein DCF33_19560 [Saprospirales bacterium]|nr:hypothetical protein [Saprospirales bacterium]
MLHRPQGELVWPQVRGPRQRFDPAEARQVLASGGDRLTFSGYHAYGLKHCFRKSLFKDGMVSARITGRFLGTGYFDLVGLGFKI